MLIIGLLIRLIQYHITIFNYSNFVAGNRFFSMFLKKFILNFLLIPSCVVHSYAPLVGSKAKSLSSGTTIDLGDFLSSEDGSSSVPYSMMILGTYAADFNAIEYGQRLRHYLPELRERGVGKVGLVLNCEDSAAKTMAESVGLNYEEDNFELLVDPLGTAGRAFGVGQGWRPDDTEMSPYLKLFGMLWGLGAWATLPAVIGGYIGNPFRPQPWITDALAVGQRKGRWPDTALELDENGEVVVNKFSELPVVGEWKRRPLELATLRLQNMVDISIKRWEDLKPTEDALKAGVLTQLGGCVIVDTKTGEVVFEWRDPGICAVGEIYCSKG